MIKQIAMFLLMSLPSVATADLITFQFSKTAAPEFFITGATATGVVDTVANTFTIMNFTSTNGGVYEVPNENLVFSAWEGINSSTLVPWNVADNATGSDVLSAINSGPFTFIANKANSAISWNSNGGGPGQIAWGAAASNLESYFFNASSNQWYGWHDADDFTNGISWNSVSFIAAVPEPSSLRLVAVVVVMCLIFYRRPRIAS